MEEEEDGKQVISHISSGGGVNDPKGLWWGWGQEH